jgi:hypothetical protein
MAQIGTILMDRITTASGTTRETTARFTAATLPTVASQQIKHAAAVMVADTKQQRHQQLLQ